MIDDPLLHNPLFYAVALPAIFILGLAKGGFAGLGMIATPLMSLVISPVQAAAILLPILIVQDVVSLWIFRGHWDLKLTAILALGAVFGIAAGWALAAWVSIAAVKLALGLTSVVFGAQRLWVERGHAMVAPSNAPAWVGVLLGVATGFTSQIAHAGGPPAQIYLMPRQLARDVFIGTSTLLFAIINWVKVPAYLSLGQFTPANLSIAAAMLPLAIASTFLGAWLIRRVDGRGFNKLIYALMILVGVKLAWDGAAALI